MAGKGRNYVSSPMDTVLVKKKKKDRRRGEI